MADSSYETEVETTMTNVEVLQSNVVPKAAKQPVEAPPPMRLPKIVNNAHNKVVPT